MVFDVRRSADCGADLEAIFDHLVASYQALGDPIADALDRAEKRLLGIEDDIDTLAALPFQGTLVPHILDGLRHVTKDRAVLYFRVDETARQIFVLGVFFGGQDHQRHILKTIAELGQT
ncbi:type II toxin-antitoxin system RelE/ParE family toxin [uncultured Paracoccus sp.]|uniref:type II toxin-antitoxin system RelE/ParE family toxin n=1 Tax=uncultured Paracoccus sp. TaxID=189685 RepID=UPI002618B58A|nr:type II toxin-antitoxin system RelE/ParE family toxin [uncultured Paracoccus sp.]